MGTKDIGEPKSRKSEGKKMGVSKGVMLAVPKQSSEKFLSCFKKASVDMDRLKQLSTIHKGRDKK
ncbi:hypothetical protein GMB50_10620 [Turicibacter sanguinis]|nr:hypothetical protein [Turicibacter sanguinis]MTP47973.1 hypothetical protein [Turicibacter sanguinis]MTP50721.1 hypothetical protein [Turicibacter sanguinis]MTQ07957.1 hypothetical protein [Turicibacter sanguinis]